MIESIIRGKTLPEAYHDALIALKALGESVPCPDYNTNQIELSMTMCISYPLQEPMISKLFIGGPHELEQYRQEMLDGILDFEVYRGNWDYTYHDRMVNFPSTLDFVCLNQIDFIIRELKRNPDSRRAVICIRDNNKDMDSNDPACLQHIQYFIRNNKLHCKVLFRSNDACKAAFMNAFALIMLQKRIADELGVEVGTYTHRANSFHCYEKDYKLLDSYVTSIAKKENITYSYIDEWKELMEDEQEAIARKVEELKNR